METNDKIIQLVGRASIDQELQLGNDYDIYINANCYRKEIVDNQDGTQNVICKIKPFGTVEIVNDRGEHKQAKMKGSKAQLLRFRIEQVDDYDVTIDKILNHFDKVYDFISKLD